MDEEKLLEVFKALYGLPTGRNTPHVHLLHTLRAMSFKPTRFEPDVWIRGRKGGYEYIGMHTDDVLVIFTNYTSIFNTFKENYTI